MIRVILFFSGLCAVYHPFLWWGCWVLGGRQAITRKQAGFWLFWILTFVAVMTYAQLSRR
ncbi:MAG: hypothetical protein KIS92_21710 [Planctomycetota bacterium]|nr:hypothetical protein [Planctomycetota bacterium]